jgi:hypothetical protein
VVTLRDIVIGRSRARLEDDGMGLVAVEDAGIDASRADEPVGAPAVPDECAHAPRADAAGQDRARRAAAEQEQAAVGELDPDRLQEAAARLCRDYATADPAVLRTRGRQLIDRLSTLTASAPLRADPARARTRRDLLVATGWASLLTACAEYDLGLAEDAERSRRTAAWVGREAGHDEIVAWAYEVGAWIALTRRRWREATELAATGQRLAPNTSAAVQLAAQEARAWARLGQRDRSETALARGERVLGRLPRQREADHHFVVDESKSHYYRLDCHRWLGDDRLAERYAHEVLTRWDHPALAADRRRPMRVAGARLSLGVVAARAGDLDAAGAELAAAVAQQRRSLPWFSLIAAELVETVRARWQHDRRGADLVEQVQAVAPGALRPGLGG